MIARRLPAWIGIAAAGCAAAGAAAFLVRAAFKIFYPYLTNLGEPALAQSIRLTGLGIWPYHDLSQPPFSVVPYGPVYLVLSAAVQSFFDLPMAGGRLVCLAASLAAAVWIGLILFRSTRSALVAVGTGCFFLALPFVGRWGVQVNVDMTAVAFDLAALWGFFRYASSGYSEKKFFWIGSAAAVAAVFTKSSAVAAAAAWTVHLLLTRRWKDLAVFAAAAGGTVLAVYAALNWGTAGQYYFHTTHEIGRRIFFWRFVADYWRGTVLAQPLNVLAAAAALAWPALWRGAPGTSLPNLYLVFTALLTVSLGKQGSDTNYLLPFIAASTLAAGRLWGQAAAGPGRSSSPASQLAGLLFAGGIAVQALAGGGIRDFSLEKIRAEHAEQKAFYDKLSGVIRQFPDPIISWDMALLIANGRPIYFEPFPMAQAAYSGVWDQTPILEDLRAGRIRLIVTYFWSKAIKADRNFTPEFIQELRAHYKLVGNVPIPGTRNQRLFFYAPVRPDGAPAVSSV